MNFETIFSLLQQDHQPTMLEQFRHYSAFQQLIATLASARTKDSTTIPLMVKLFQQHSTPQDFINLPLAQLEQSLYGIGFYKVKAKHIQQLSKILITRYNCKVPSTFEELTSLPGVGRKTANCILAYTFHQPAIAVDIHVHRISNRLGWIKTSTPEETENALQKIIPKTLWSQVNELLVDHGQRVCQPRKPKCGSCKIKDYCIYSSNINKQLAAPPHHTIS